MTLTIEKIISGGQTGADRAALDFAIGRGIPHGGWIPKGRKSEDGMLPDAYQMQEMPTASRPMRTEQNVLDSDGTLIVSHGKLSGGSALTQRLAEKHKRPHIHLDMNQLSVPAAAEVLGVWIEKNGIQILNVAGPRASNDPDIYSVTAKLLEALALAGLTAVCKGRSPEQG